VSVFIDLQRLEFRQVEQPGNVAYVLEMPQAKSRDPHQGPEHKYYKRHNFKAEPMEDYEVRDFCGVASSTVASTARH
jgi:hypothetical protein